MDIITIETPSLGDRTYVVHDGPQAAVIDPQRDIDRVLDVLETRALQLVAVFETHVHNDYVSGGLELAGRTGADYHLSAAEELAFEHVATNDGDEVKVGDLVIRAVHTPGHTPTHMSYVVSEAGIDQAVFSGGGLLYGSVGRTDLISVEMTEELSRLQFRSARRLAAELADDVEVLPTHGFGSFCSSGETTGSSASTIGLERAHNQALTYSDEDEFVAALLAGLDAWPAYYAHMGPTNRRGPVPVDLSPASLADATEVRRRIHAGEWVVDLRNRRAFADGHLIGTINVEMGDSLSTYLGWIIPWGTSVTLLGETPEEVADAQRQLVRIGIDRPAAQAHHKDLADHSDATYHVADFAQLHGALGAAEHGGPDGHVVVVDTRLRLEWEGGHLPGAVHIPLHELLERMDEIPDGQVWVHCASGYRASIAASLLDRAGRDVVLVDQELSEAFRHFHLVS